MFIVSDKTVDGVLGLVKKDEFKAQARFLSCQPLKLSKGFII